MEKTTQRIGHLLEPSSEEININTIFHFMPAECECEMNAELVGSRSVGTVAVLVDIEIIPLTTNVAVDC